MGVTRRGRGKTVKKFGRGPCTYCGRVHRHSKKEGRRVCCRGHGRSQA